MTEVAASSVRAQNVGVDRRPDAQGEVYTHTDRTMPELQSEGVVCCSGGLCKQNIANVPMDALRLKS